MIEYYDGQRRHMGARARRKRRHDIYGVLLIVASLAIVMLVIWLDARPAIVC